MPGGWSEILACLERCWFPRQYWQALGPPPTGPREDVQRAGKGQLPADLGRSPVGRARLQSERFWALSGPSSLACAGCLLLIPRAWPSEPFWHEKVSLGRPNSAKSARVVWGLPRSRIHSTCPDDSRTRTITTKRAGLAWCAQFWWLSTGWTVTRSDRRRAEVMLRM